MSIGHYQISSDHILCVHNDSSFLCTMNIFILMNKSLSTYSSFVKRNNWIWAVNSTQYNDPTQRSINLRTDGLNSLRKLAWFWWCVDKQVLGVVKVDLWHLPIFLWCQYSHNIQFQAINSLVTDSKNIYQSAPTNR